MYHVWHADVINSTFCIMCHSTYIEALTHLQRNGVADGAYIYDMFPSFSFHVGTIDQAESRCRFHFVEVRADRCRIIERSYNFPQKSEWIVRPWITIEQAIIAAQRPNLAA